MAFYQVKPDRERAAGWLIFEVADIPFYVQPFFLLLVAYLAMPVAQNHHSMALAGMFGLVVFISLIVHEAGHALACRLFGLQPITVVLHGFGGYTSHPPTTHPRSLAIIAAGPLGTVLMIVLGMGIPYFFPGVMRYQASDFVFGWMASLNFLWLVVNILPIFPMDGGQFLFHLLTFVWREPRAIRITAIVSLVVCLMVAAVMYYFSQGFSINMILLAMFASQNIDILRRTRL